MATDTSERLEPLEATVDAWLEATRDVVLDERERGKVLDTKTAQVTGFIGVILALDATLAQATLTRFLAWPYSWLLPVLYLAAIAFLITGALAAIIGSLLPQKTAAFERTQFEELADGDAILSEPVEVKRTLIRSYGIEVSAESHRNSGKATALQVASVCFALGLIAVCGQAATLGVRALHMTDRASQTPMSASPAQEPSVSQQTPAVAPLSARKSASERPMPPKVLRFAELKEAGRPSRGDQK